MHRRANEARAQFETLLNEAPLGVYLVDEDFRIAAVNPVAAPVFGDIPGLVGRDFDEVIHLLWPKAYADEIVRLFRHTLETGEPHIEPERIEQRLDRGVTEYYEWRASRIPLPGNRRGVVCYFRDISKAVLAREALREADTRKDEFLATLAHELRNPLAPLRSSLDTLKISGAHAAPPNSSLEIMERQLSHLVRLVDDLMEVSRITRGNFELRKEPVRLELALRSALEACEPLIRAGDHRLNVSLPQEPIVLEADPVRLAQVFGNLLNNAAKYSDGPRHHHGRGAPRGARGGGGGERHGRRHPRRAAAAAFQDLLPRQPQRAAQPERPRHRARAGAPPGRDARRPRRRGKRGPRKGQPLHRAAALERRAAGGSGRGPRRAAAGCRP